MNRPRMSTVVRVAVAVAAVAGTVVIVREMFVCRPPRDEAEMIELFKADPLFAVTADIGQLVDEHARTYSCDSGHGDSPTSPGFAEVMRLYQAPAPYNLDRLHQRFDQPAAAAGWRIDEARSDLSGSVVYCKEAAGRASHAWLSPMAGGQPPTAVRVILSAGRDGTKCFLD